MLNTHRNWGNSINASKLIYFVSTFSSSLGSGSFSGNWPLREGHTYFRGDVTVDAMQLSTIFFTLWVTQSFVMDTILNHLLKKKYISYICVCVCVCVYIYTHISSIQKWTYNLWCDSRILLSQRLILGIFFFFLSSETPPEHSLLSISMIN